MSGLFVSGHVVDLILLIMAVEGVFLALHFQRSGRGIAPRDLFYNLSSGICLLLALRAALTGADWGWIGLALSASLVGHLADLGRRWRLG